MSNFRLNRVIRSLVGLSIPDVGDKYLSITCYDEDMYITAYETAPAQFKLRNTEDMTRYQVCGLRLAVDNQEEIPELHKMQDKGQIISPQGTLFFIIILNYAVSHDKQPDRIISIG